MQHAQLSLRFLVQSIPFLRHLIDFGFLTSIRAIFIDDTEFAADLLAGQVYLGAVLIVDVTQPGGAVEGEVFRMPVRRRSGKGVLRSVGVCGLVGFRLRLGFGMKVLVIIRTGNRRGGGVVLLGVLLVGGLTVEEETFTGDDDALALVFVDVLGEDDVSFLQFVKGREVTGLLGESGGFEGDRLDRLGDGEGDRGEQGDDVLHV